MIRPRRHPSQKGVAELVLTPLCSFPWGVARPPVRPRSGPKWPRPRACRQPRHGADVPPNDVPNAVRAARRSAHRGPRSARRRWPTSPVQTGRRGARAPVSRGTDPIFRRGREPARPRPELFVHPSTLQTSAPSTGCSRGAEKTVVHPSGRRGSCPVHAPYEGRRFASTRQTASCAIELERRPWTQPWSGMRFAYSLAAAQDASPGNAASSIPRDKHSLSNRPRSRGGERVRTSLSSSSHGAFV